MRKSAARLVQYLHGGGRVEIAVLDSIGVKVAFEEQFVSGGVAVDHAQQDMALLLLDKGANPNARCFLDRTPIDLPAVRGDDETVGLLLAKGADIKAADKGGSTVLHYAVQGSSTGLVKLLLEKGVDPNAKNGVGCTPLHFASIYGRESGGRMPTRLVSMGRKPSLKAGDSDLRRKSPRSGSTNSGSATRSDPSGIGIDFVDDPLPADTSHSMVFFVYREVTVVVLPPLDMEKTSLRGEYFSSV